MDKVQIINELIEYKGFKTKAKFAEFIGISPQLLSKWMERNTFDIDKMVIAFPEINAIWLLTGKGEMLKEPVSAGAAGMTSVYQKLLDEKDSRIADLNKQVEFLKQQIEEKDKQIIEKDKRIAELILPGKCSSYTEETTKNTKAG